MTGGATIPSHFPTKPDLNLCPFDSDCVRKMVRCMQMVRCMHAFMEPWTGPRVHQHASSDTILLPSFPFLSSPSDDARRTLFSCLVVMLVLRAGDTDPGAGAGDSGILAQRQRPRRAKTRRTYYSN